jgi:thioesterase domain-containing protein/acyl carrier protein
VPVGTIPAGRPVVNKEVVLLREDQSVAEAGEAGDIVVLSDYLSGGYWADEAANDARFGLSSTGQRLCRQGDLGRFDANGDLILLGRTDTAVKVRGYLVEPSEIEAALLATGEIEEAVVVPVVAPPAMTRLIAYVVPLPGTRSPAPAALRRELRTRLPEYMIPAAILLMPTLPRNERGKVDRTLLPLVPESGATTETMDPRQRVVAGIWCTILGLNSVGLDDDFMALGGDSLSAEELMATVAEQFQVPLVSSDLMEFPTLREFTRRITMGAANLPRHPDVITLHAGGDETPLFCFAGSGALALTFLPLSRHFPERPVYAFQAHGLEKRGIPDWSVPASARRFLETIRILRPRGPYLLVGHSFGGLVALEIARQLTEAGESVELVGLLDTYFPSSSGQLPTLAFATLPPAVPGVVARTLSRVHRNPRRSTPSGRSVLRLSARRLRAVAAGIIVYSGQRQFDVFFDHGIIASHRYQVPRYQGKTLFAITHDNPDREAWEKILPPSAPILEFPSEHTAMLREPHATSLAALIHAHLDDPATE